MPSPLSFDSTENFRKKLLIRNLKPNPYELGIKFPGSPGEGPLSIFDLGVIDPGNIEDIGQIEEVNLYKKNKYGPENNDGAYGSTVDIFYPTQETANQGEYDYYSSSPPLTTEQSLENLFLQNFYGPQGGFQNLVDIQDVHQVVNQRDIYYRFIYSQYSSYSILTNNDPQGSSGLLSQDSNLAQIAANQLKTEFEHRVAQETFQQTLGRINAVDAIDDPFRLLGMLKGREGVIERDYHISVPNNVVGKGLDFISRISGVYSPYSWIPGDYFSLEDRKSFVNQAVNAITGLFDKKGTLKLPTNKTSSDIFLKNTGGGQRQRLSINLEMNRFRPDYKANFTDNLNITFPKGNYYIGDRTTEIGDIISPEDQLPLNQDGDKSRIPVKGYSELGKVYENNLIFNFGLNSYSFYDKFNALGGGFAWVGEGSPIFEKVGVGGQPYSDSTTAQQTSIWDFSTQSDVYDFTKGSILYNTQQIVNSALKLEGVKRQQHVGHAINQVSKVFFDGNREITKGSAVLKWVDENNEIVANEYCRVFTKDNPYFLNSDLQKTEGITESNRRFTYSVLDNTYNLNIAPWRDKESTNIKNGEVKKYMFSIENLAWRSSSKKGFTYEDLPHAERGPNGGRIMWFPPYDLTVSESNSVNWTDNVFLGRPEPIYTYNNTTRTGSLNWSIVVDHPSILNAIVDKELQGESSRDKVNSIVDSFFAGCRKYDIYELATRFPQFTYKDIYDIITKTEDQTAFREYRLELPSEPTNPVSEEFTSIIIESDWNTNYYYFSDNSPSGVAGADTTDNNWSIDDRIPYVAEKTIYINQNTGLTSSYESFFNDILQSVTPKTTELTNKMMQVVKDGGKVQITLTPTQSPKNDDSSYINSLLKRRIESVKNYILETVVDGSKLKIYEENIIFNYGTPDINSTLGSTNHDCSEKFLDSEDSEYSLKAIACRRVRISDLNVIPPSDNDINDFVPEYEKEDINENVTLTGNTTTQKKTQNLEPKENVAKIIVKKLLNEGSYFEFMKEDSPRIYDGIKEKIKYFQPAFHSMTPEGLNSRLTFLQQCLRPGETIPLLDEDGRPTNSNANNTSFGAPPICILRVGDFYHTKIAITQIGISYEPLIFDLNPEGIGVQPMIAKINMSFNFIGGQGLKEPVSRLQNALSFNFYGNTEIYDERSVVTDSESSNELDSKIMKKIEDETDFGLGQYNNQNEDSDDAGQTIGVTEEQTIIEILSGQTISGTTSYKNISNELIEKASNYTNTVTNFMETVINEDSKIMAYYSVNKRKFTSGNISNYFDQPNAQLLNIFGNPTEQQLLRDTLFNDLLEDVENGTTPMMKDIQFKNFKSSEIKLYKKNLTNIINNQKNEFLSTFESNISEVINSEIELIKTLNKLNLVLDNTDGYRNKKGDIFIYPISATTEIDTSSPNTPSDTREELLNDINLVGEDLGFYYESIFLGGTNSLLNPNINSLYEGFFPSNLDTPEYTRFATAFFKRVINDTNKFIYDCLGEELSLETKWFNYVKDIVNKSNTEGLKYEYTLFDKKGKNSVSRFKSYDNVKKFNDYQPYSKDKVRLYTFVKYKSNDADSQKVENFQLTYQQGNNGNPLLYNLKNKLE